MAIRARNPCECAITKDHINVTVPQPIERMRIVAVTTAPNVSIALYLADAAACLGRPRVSCITASCNSQSPIREQAFPLVKSRLLKCLLPTRIRGSVMRLAFSWPIQSALLSRCAVKIVPF